MKKFVFIYNGPQSTSAPDPEVSKAWGEWFESLGTKLVDPGNPFGSDVINVSGNGIKNTTENRATGYTIVNAEDIDEASEMAIGCPNNNYDGYWISIYEAMPM